MNELTLFFIIFICLFLIVTMMSCNFIWSTAYLEWREPLMINSNWYMLGRDDVNHPHDLLVNNGIRPSGQFTYYQVHRAAHMIHRGLEYKEKLEK